MAKFNYGGQAVVEGVMMRGRASAAVAVRSAGGGIIVHEERLNPRVYARQVAQWPFVRGVLLLWDMLILGTRMMMFAASVSVQSAGAEGEDRPESASIPAGAVADASAADAAGLGGIGMTLTLIFSLAFAIGLFFLLPLAAVGAAHRWLGSGWLSLSAEGLIRLALLIGYLALIGRFPSIQRVFMYHGAEHKTINAFESGWTLDVASVRRASTLHPRCGTGFLLVVLVVSVIVFSIVALFHPNLFWLVASRILAIPIIAGVGFELIRFMAVHRTNPIVGVALLPVLGTQKFTTRQPTDDMLEVAIVAFNSAREGEEESAGAAA
jgi:uncharacterized protein YqhQ